MISAYRHITIILLLLGAAASLAAQELPPAVPQEALARLDERIAFLKTEFPSMPMAKLLAGSPRPAIVALVTADPRKAMETIEQLHKKLDRSVFPALKKQVYSLGVTIEQNQTTKFSAARRRDLLLEFVDILKRQGLVINTFYPGGLAKFLMIQGDSDEACKAIDERYATLAARLKSDIEQAAATGGGGGGGGSSSGSWGLDEDEPAEQPVSPVRSRDDDLGSAAEGRSMSARTSDWMPIVLAGVALIVVGSILCLLLPRVVAYSRDFFKTGFTRKMAVVEDALKTGITLYQRSKFDKALEQFLRVSAEPGERAITGRYYTALCEVKLGRRTKAVQDISSLPLNSLSNEEIYRLGRACEEAGYTDTALSLFREVHGRDPSYKDVRQRLGKDSG